MCMENKTKYTAYSDVTLERLPALLKHIANFFQVKMTKLIVDSYSEAARLINIHNQAHHAAAIHFIWMRLLKAVEYVLVVVANNRRAAGPKLQIAVLQAFKQAGS